MAACLPNGFPQPSSLNFTGKNTNILAACDYVPTPLIPDHPTTTNPTITSASPLTQPTTKHPLSTQPQPQPRPAPPIPPSPPRPAPLLVTVLIENVHCLMPLGIKSTHSVDNKLCLQPGMLVDGKPCKEILVKSLFSPCLFSQFSNTAKIRFLPKLV